MLFSHYIKIYEENRKRIDCIIIAGLISLAFYICFYKLGYSPLSDWDEAWYAEVTKQFIRTGNYIVPYWNGAPFLDKPPLYMWISSLFSFFLGLNELSVRLTSAITGFATILLASWYVWMKWGILPSFLTFATLALNNIYIWRVRSGNLDALATFFIFMIFLAILSKHKYRHIFLGLLFSAIFLTKASLVGLPILIFVVYELLYRRQYIYENWKNYFITVFIFISIVGSWILLASLQVGWHFAEYYLFKSDQGVSETSLEHFKLNYWWHTYYALQRRFFFVFILGIVFLITQLRKEYSFLLLTFSLSLIFLLTFTERDNNWYLVPTMPFWSLVVGYGTYRFINLLPEYKYIAILIVLIPTLYVSQKTLKENILPIINTTANTELKEAALYISKYSGEDELVIRLDHSYPSSIFYTDRKVKSSFNNDSSDGTGIYVGHDYVSNQLQKENIKWIFGPTEAVTSFKNNYSIDGKIIEVNQKEIILTIDSSL